MKKNQKYHLTIETESYQRVIDFESKSIDQFRQNIFEILLRFEKQPQRIIIEKNEDQISQKLSIFEKPPELSDEEIRRQKEYFDLLEKKREYESSKTTCLVCGDQKTKKECMTMKCDHSLCNGCAKEYAIIRVKEGIAPIKCVSQECREFYPQNEMLEILPEELKEKYLKFEFNKFIQKNRENYSCCMTPGCSFVFNKIEGYIFKCPECKKKYCLDCGCEMHEGSSCIDYRKWRKLNKKGDKLFVNFVKGKKFKQCKNCNVWVEKKSGCNHMTCVCRYQFCYICGAKWRTCKC